MRPRMIVGSLLAVVGIVAFIFTNAPALGLSTITSAQPFYYACSVTSETGVGVSNCYMFLLGPEPDGSYYLGSGLSFFGLSCLTPGQTWSPSITWTYSPGNTSTGIGPSPQHYLTLPSQVQLTWTISIPGAAGGTATGSATLYSVSGTNSFTNKFNPQYPSCQSSTSTSTTASSSTTSTPSASSSTTAAVSTSSSSTSASTAVSGTAATSSPPRPPLDPLTTGISGAFIIAGLGVMLVGRRP